MAYRIHITGASGSGTTTLGKSVAQTLGIGFFDADSYYWLPTTPPFRDKRPKDERLAMLNRDLAACSSYVLAGSICGWDPTLEGSFSLIVFLSIPDSVRLDRLREREMQRYRSINQEFIDWAAQYESGDLTVRSRMRHEHWLRERTCPILRLDGDLTNKERMVSVIQTIQSV